MKVVINENLRDGSCHYENVKRLNVINSNNVPIVISNDDSVEENVSVIVNFDNIISLSIGPDQ